MDPSAVSQQLGILRQLRFVVAERAGRRMRYRLHDEHVAELLAAVRHYHAHASRGWRRRPRDALPASAALRRSPGRYAREADERAERELDEILCS